MKRRHLWSAVLAALMLCLGYGCVHYLQAVGSAARFLPSMAVADGSYKTLPVARLRAYLSPADADRVYGIARAHWERRLVEQGATDIRAAVAPSPSPSPSAAPGGKAKAIPTPRPTPPTLFAVSTYLTWRGRDGSPKRGYWNGEFKREADGRWICRHVLMQGL